MEKEMIENYAVENSVNVGGKRFLFCISTDENEPHPYMKCRERSETFLAHYENAIAGNDYLEVMKLYVRDISDAIAEFENELFEYLVATREDLLSDIRSTGVLSDDNAQILRDSINACKEKFLA